MTLMKNIMRRGVVLCLLAALLPSTSAFATGYDVSAEIDPNNADVIVTVTATDECRIAVAWYDATEQLLSVSMLDTGSEKISFSYLASENAPKDVSAKAFLLDKDSYMPLCQAANAVKQSQVIELPEIPI